MVGSNHNSNDEHSVPSGSQNQPQPPPEPVPDEQLFPEAEYLDLKANNHHLDFDTMKTEHPVILEILKGHPLEYVLSATANIPLVYLQQFWNTMTYVSLSHFEARLDRFLVELTKKKLRKILKLPKKTAFLGKQDFDRFASESEICSDVLRLGYTEPLTSAAKFKRMYLPPIWYTLFSILNRGLTSKHTGLDKCSLNVLTLFHGVAFNRHYDYTLIFWSELKELVANKQNTRARKFVPYMRFLQLIIWSFMRRNKNIPSRSTSPVCPEFEMKYFRTEAADDFPNTLPLPDELLDYADQNAECVREYRTLKASMVRPEPKGPTHETIPEVEERREGSVDRTEQDHGTGVPDQGVMRENENERGNEGDMGASDSIAQENIVIHSEQHTSTLQDIQIEQIIETLLDLSQKFVESDIPVVESIDFDEADDHDMHFNVSDIHIENVITQITGVQGRTEGDLVENVENLSEGSIKEHGESVIGSKEQNDASQTVSVTRVATSAIGSHVLGSDIEQDVMDPVTHTESTPHSHSDISQQMSVSIDHGDFSHNLSSSHLKSVGIETGRHLLQSPTSFLAQQSLEPETLVGTQRAQSAIVCLGDIAGTSVVASSDDVLQGSDGSPTRVNAIPALNVGHTVDSDVVTTGYLCDLGNVTIPEFVSKSYFDSVLKGVTDLFKEEMDSLKRMYKGKGVAADKPTSLPPPPQQMDSLKRMYKRKGVAADKPTSLPPPPQQQPRAPSSDDLTVDELKSLLYAKLLSLASDSDQADADLVGLLRRQTEVTANTVTVEHLTSFKKEMTSSLSSLTKTVQESLQQLTERVNVLEQTCKAQASDLKRKHDDADDSDHN